MCRVVFAGWDVRTPSAVPESSETALRKRLPSARGCGREAFATYVEGGLRRFRSRGPPSLCPSVCRESEKGLRKRLPSARERAREAFATYVEGGLCRFRSRGPVGR